MSRLNQVLVVLAASVASLPAWSAEYSDAHEQARNLLSRPLVTANSQPSPEIRPSEAIDEFDAFRQAMILLGH